VEVEGARSLVAACSTPAAPGQAVQTESPRVVAARRVVLELLLASGNHSCAANLPADAADWTALQLNVQQAEETCADYPLVLSTGRRLAHYHTRTQTGRCEGLNEILSEETADISPRDAAELGIRDGERICARSRRDRVEIKARVTARVPRGLVWMSFHFRDTNANWLTNPAFDPSTLTAEYKACAVRIEKLCAD
jgi:formate dehydrogenase major subunit